MYALKHANVLRSDKMANMKRLEKRLENVEKWLKEFEKGTGPAQTMDNMNFLVGQTRIIGEQMQNLQNQNRLYQQPHPFHPYLQAY